VGGCIALLKPTEKLYLHIFDWPKDGKLHVPLKNKPLLATLVAKDQSLDCTAVDDGITIRVPAEAPDKIASVIALQLDRPAEVLSVRLQPAADGSLMLKAADAEIAGSAQLEEYNGVSNIGFWMDAKTTVSWDVEVPAGDYNVELCYAADPSADGNQFKVVAGNQSVVGTIRETGAWSRFTTASLDKLTVPPGTKTITVTPTKVSGPVMNLRWIKLVKAGRSK
jgi:alpha-L-fucosidase